MQMSEVVVLTNGGLKEGEVVSWGYGQPDVFQGAGATPPPLLLLPPPFEIITKKQRGGEIDARSS